MDYGEYPQRVTPPYKSKAEIQIARLLDRERIAFRYEHPLAVIDGSKTKIWYGRSKILCAVYAWAGFSEP